MRGAAAWIQTEIWPRVRSMGAGIGRNVGKMRLVVGFTLLSVFALPDGEFFPFSSYPMYSRNKEKSYLVYLRDDAGNPVASEKVLGVRGSVLKKDYNAQLDKQVKALGMSDYDMTAEQRKPAGESALRYLIEERASHRVDRVESEWLELVDMRLERRDGKINRSEEVVARWPLP